MKGKHINGETEVMPGASYSDKKGDTKNTKISQVLPQCTQTSSEMDEELVMSDRPREVIETSSARLVVIALKFQASLDTQAK